MGMALVEVATTDLVMISSTAPSSRAQSGTSFSFTKMEPQKILFSMLRLQLFLRQNGLKPNQLTKAERLPLVISVNISRCFLTVEQCMNAMPITSKLCAMKDTCELWTIHRRWMCSRVCRSTTSRRARFLLNKVHAN